MTIGQVSVLEPSVIRKLAEWRGNTEQFVVEALRATPTKQQREFCKAFDTEPRISIRSGHGPGKTTAAAWAIMKYLCCYHKPFCLCTAPTSHQLHDNLWREIKKWIDQSIFKEELVWNNERVYHKDSRADHAAVARSINVNASEEDQAVTLAGRHADNLLIVVDEASGVPDPVFRPIEGAVTKPGNQILLIGNMTQRSGFFYNTHFDDMEAKFWCRLHWNAEDSENVAREMIEYYLSKYGRETNVYRIRIQGEPPLEDPNYTAVIPLHFAEACIGNEIVIPPDAETVLGVDVARFGDDDSVVMPSKGRKIGEYRIFSGIDTQNLGFLINEAILEFNAARVGIDEIGVGAGVVDYLKQIYPRGDKIFGINVANKSTQEARYLRLRDQLWWIVRENCRRRAYSFPAGEQGRLLVNELATPTYDTVGNRIKVEGKKELRKRNKPSPNRAESLLMIEAVYLGRPDLLTAQSLEKVHELAGRGRRNFHPDSWMWQ